MIGQTPSLRFRASRAKAIIGLLVLAPFALVAWCLIYDTIYILPSATAEGAMSVTGIVSVLVAVITVGAIIIAILGAAFPSKIDISTDEILFTKLGFIVRKFHWPQLSEPYLTGEDMGEARLGMDVLGGSKKVIFSPADYRVDSGEMLNFIRQARQGQLANSAQIESAQIGNIAWKVGALFIAVIILKAILFASAVRH